MALVAGLTAAERMDLGRAQIETLRTKRFAPIVAAVEQIVARRVQEAEIAGQMKHITAEMVRGDQPLEAKEELIADLRARLSHAEAERDDLAALADPETETDRSEEIERG